MSGSVSKLVSNLPLGHEWLASIFLYWSCFNKDSPGIVIQFGRLYVMKINYRSQYVKGPFMPERKRPQPIKLW